MLIEGTTGAELAMAFNHYLKHIANCSVSWRGTGGNLRLPPALPQPPTAGVRIDRSSKWSYYANVCTFSYSFVWYDLDAWIREIDWMAMNGINRSLTCPAGHDGEVVSRNTVTGIPFGKVWDKPFSTDDPTSGATLYDNAKFSEGWKLMLDAAAAEPSLLTATTTFPHDLVDVTRQALAKHAAGIYRNLSTAWAANSSVGIAREGGKLLGLIDDLDTVLASQEGFLFGKWVADAETHGTTEAEKSLMAWNAGHVLGVSAAGCSVRQQLRLPAFDAPGLCVQAVGGAAADIPRRTVVSLHQHDAGAAKGGSRQHVRHPALEHGHVRLVQQLAV